MFEELFDSISFVWSFRWPTAQGEVTDALAERVGSGRDEKFRLSIAYKFSIGDDGPYSGESLWSPAFCMKRRVLGARRKFRVHKPVSVRYRPDDPSVNCLDRSTWREL